MPDALNVTPDTDTVLPICVPFIYARRVLADLTIATWYHWPTEAVPPVIK